MVSGYELISRMLGKTLGPTSSLPVHAFGYIGYIG